MHGGTFATHGSLRTIHVEARSYTHANTGALNTGTVVTNASSFRGIHLRRHFVLRLLLQDANTALNNLVDAIAPDNAAGFAFAQAVRNLLHASAGIADRRAAFAQLQEQLNAWARCVGQAQVGQGSDKPLAALLGRVVERSVRLSLSLSVSASSISESYKSLNVPAC